MSKRRGLTDTATVLFTPEEVADRCGVSTATVYRWIREGELDVVRRGSRFTRIPADSLIDFVARYTINQTKQRWLRAVG